MRAVQKDLMRESQKGWPKVAQRGKKRESRRDLLRVNKTEPKRGVGWGRKLAILMV